MGDHDDELVTADLPENLHDLDAGLAVQRACGLICQDDIRIVHEGAGDGHPLHLAAGELVRPLLQLILQADTGQDLDGPAAALLTADPGEGERQLDICQDALVRDQVIALEDKTDRMIPEGIPVIFRKIAGGFATDDQITLGIVIQPADDIQQGGLSAAGGAEDGGKLAFAEFQVDTAEGFHTGVPGGVMLYDPL